MEPPPTPTPEARVTEGVGEHTHEQAVSLTYVVVERLGLAGMFACLPPVRSGAVQIPEDAADRQDSSETSLQHGPFSLRRTGPKLSAPRFNGADSGPIDEFWSRTGLRSAGPNTDGGAELSIGAADVRGSHDA